MKKQVSPVPTKKPKTLTFAQALDAILDKKRVTRLEWEENDQYGFLADDGFLSIHRDGKDHRWLVNDGDMLAVDWIVLPQ